MKKIFTSVLTLFALALTASAQLAYNQAFTQSDFNNSATVVKKQGSCSYSNSNGIVIGGTGFGDGFNWDDKYVDIVIENGFSSSVSFSYATSSNAATGVEWYVKESANGSDWSASIWTSTSKNGSADVSLSKNTRYIRVCWSGNFAGYVKNLVVAGTKAVITYGSAEATVCSSELPYLFNGQEIMESGSVTLSGANMFGLDSIITLTLNVLPSYELTVDTAMYVGYATEWREQDLSELAVGFYTLYDSLQTEAGCDSVYVLHLAILQTQSQTITLVDEFQDEYTIKEGDPLNVSFVAYAETALTITSSDEEVATVAPSEENENEYVLTLLAEGETTITITASQVLPYLEAVQTYDIVVKYDKGSPTGTQNIHSDLQVKKQLRNGALLIIRDARTYNVNGQRLN